MSDTSDNEFIEALNKEFGIEPEAKETPPQTPPTDPTPAENGEGEQQVQQGSEGEQVPPAGQETKPAEGEPAKSPVNGDDKQELDENGQPKVTEQKKTEDAEQPKPLSAQDIKEAMREYNNETVERVERVHSARDEIIGVLHPEGIDKNIYDSNGEQIKTAQDMVDRGLINPRTQTEFTYEEAQSWLLNAQAQMNKNVEELNQYAENIAETNVSLVESNQRVMETWGDILKAMPKLADELATTYVQTQLKFDKTGSYIVSVGMSPEQYYQLTLSPYKELGAQMAQSQEAEAQRLAEQKRQEEEAEQQERSGLPPQRGQSKTKSNTGDEFLDALVDELNEG